MRATFPAVGVDEDGVVCGVGGGENDGGRVRRRRPRWPPYLLSFDCKGKQAESSADIDSNALKVLPPSRVIGESGLCLRSAGVFEESAADFHPSVRPRSSCACIQTSK